jgi:hypothetical protein
MLRWLLSKKGNRSQEDMEKRKVLHTVGRNVSWHNYNGNSKRFPQSKPKIQCDIEILLPGIAKGNEIWISKGYLHTYVHCSTIHNFQDMETTCMSTDE